MKFFYLFFFQKFDKLFKKIHTKRNHMKNCSKTFHSSLLAYLIKGAILFALLSVSYYVYAAITYPPQPNPASGVVGLYVGKTATTYDGDDAGSYAAANAFCAGGAGDMKNSHVCSPMEMVNTYNHNPGAVNSEIGFLWLNSGAPANTTPAINDCMGWSSTADTVYGNIWVFDSTDAGGIAPCEMSFAYACCK
jgi:hypothetical protein